MLLHVKKNSELKNQIIGQDNFTAKSKRKMLLFTEKRKKTQKVFITVQKEKYKVQNQQASLLKAPKASKQSQPIKGQQTDLSKVQHQYKNQLSSQITCTSI